MDGAMTRTPGVWALSLCIALLTHGHVCVQAGNPIVANHSIADPHIHIFGGVAYMYAGRDLSATSTSFSMPDWHVWSSPDLVSLTDLVAWLVVVVVVVVVCVDDCCSKRSAGLGSCTCWLGWCVTSTGGQIHHCGLWVQRVVVSLGTWGWPVPETACRHTDCCVCVVRGAWPTSVHTQVHWTHVTTIFPNQTYIGNNQGRTQECWATDVARSADGKTFAFYFSHGGSDTGVMTATTPTLADAKDALNRPLVASSHQPTKPAATHVTNLTRAAYDPTVLVDSDGSTYICLGK